MPGFTRCPRCKALRQDVYAGRGNLRLENIADTRTAAAEICDHIRRIVDLESKRIQGHHGCGTTGQYQAFIATPFVLPMNTDGIVTGLPSRQAHVHQSIAASRVVVDDHEFCTGVFSIQHFYAELQMPLISAALPVNVPAGQALQPISLVGSTLSPAGREGI